MTIRVSALLAEVPGIADHEARRLLLAATDRDTGWLIGDPEVSPEAMKRFQHYLARRRAGEPLQYIEGTVQFGPIELATDRRALIPRPETERLWEVVVDELGDGDPEMVVVDLCTGSGNLALAIKHTLPQAQVYGVDASAEALDLAGENRERLGLDVTFLCGDLFAALPAALLGRVRLLISNPPYVAADELACLPEEVRSHEPATALLAGEEGTEVLARIAADAGRWLHPGGLVACEIGEKQAAACARLFAEFSPQVLPDLTGRPRFVLGRAPQRVDVH